MSITGNDDVCLQNKLQTNQTTQHWELFFFIIAVFKQV